MTEHHPAEQPGHLDIDAVSAFVDRDLGPDELDALEHHLSVCPECLREVFEIRTTVLLLAALPQYLPRRSFCLSGEHVRRSHRDTAGNPWTGGAASPWQPAPGATAPPLSGRSSAWLPGLQTIAVAVGALLLLVTMTDMFGFPTNEVQFAAPVMLVPTATAAPAEVAREAPPVAADGQTAEINVAAPAAEPAAFLGAADTEGDGTTGLDSASEEMAKEVAPAPARASGAASSVVALVTPRAGVSAAPTVTAAAPDAAAPAATDDARPSPTRMAQIVLALILGWLIVTIVGLRRVRALS